MIPSTNERNGQMPDNKIIHDPTTIINNIVDMVHDAQKETLAMVLSLDETDYKQDTETNEWHPVSIQHDQRRDAMDEADDALRDALSRLTAAFNLSVNIDHK
jgi:sugar-specific transcriptional regulator TrmB